MQRHRVKPFALGFLFGVIAAVGAFRPLVAQIGLSWAKAQVVPVVLVEPGIGGFRPIEGTPIGNSWRKDEVTPMCRVKPAIGGFVPIEGNTIGNVWRKDQVRPMIPVKPSMGAFVPAGQE
jgi:hypothetical protein